MIQQEIKIHDEPKKEVKTYPTTYNYGKGYAFYGQRVTKKELDDARQIAMTQYKVGMRLKTSMGRHIEITGFETDPEKASIYGNEPGVILAKFVGPDNFAQRVSYGYPLSELADMTTEYV